jgi:arylsulfatase A-like enzyme/tetratricopeptide (TPR) repeat protein
LTHRCGVRPLSRGLRIVFALSHAGALAACGSRHDVSTSATASRPSVLLVTIDTLRADHVGVYGRPQAKTPVLDALAGRGLRFETAVAHAPLTGPSHASILTGLTPLRHGVRNNGGYVLPASLPTLAEGFAKAGYRTAAFVSGFPLDKRFGFARGFAAYDDRLPHGDDPRRAPYVERPADETTAAALAWLAADPGAPFFLWVHYYDPHSPYEAPPPLRTEFKDSPYDGEIAFVDRQLGLLLARAENRPGPGALVLVTADHGESLGEHGEETHGIFVYDSTLKVPFVIAGPGVSKGLVSKTLARGIDVAPTLLDLAGLPALAGAEGRSLRPAAGGAAMSDEPAYAESLFAQLHLGWAPLHAWRTARFKFVDAPRPELYDLQADPEEEHDLAGSQAPRVAEMQKRMAAALAADTPRAAAAVSADTSERLGALGYLGGGVAAPATPAPGKPLRDPKDGLAIIQRLERGMAEVRTQPQAAVAELTRVLAEDPGAMLARRYRAVALAASGQHDKAIADMRLLEQAGPLSAEDLMVLGDSQRLAGRPAEALASLEAAAQLQPQSPLPWINRGGVLLKENRLDEAAAAFQKALELAPEHAEALRGLGDVAFVRGDASAAASFFERLLKGAPEDVPARLKLGVARMQARQPDAALALFREAVEREPKNADALLYLAGALSASGRGAEALPYFERSLAESPRSTMAWNGLGFTRLDLGDAAGAADALRRSLAVDPRQPEVRAALAQLGAPR